LSPTLPQYEAEDNPYTKGLVPAPRGKVVVTHILVLLSIGRPNTNMYNMIMEVLRTGHTLQSTQFTSWHQHICRWIKFT